MQPDASSFPQWPLQSLRGFSYRKKKHRQRKSQKLMNLRRRPNKFLLR